MAAEQEDMVPRVSKFRAVGIILLVGVVGVLLLAESHLVARFQFWAWPRSRTAHLMGKWNEYLWSVARIGASKEEVQSRFGSPHNLDNGNVWIWVREYERAVSLGITDWRRMATEGGDGYFIIFKGNKAASPPLPLSGADVEMLYERMVVNGESFPGKAGAKGEE